MGSLTSLMDLSRNALLASQAAIDITSNNVANANTPNYTEQVAVWTTNDSVTIGAGFTAGEGASVSAVSQRDPVLNQRVQQQTQAESASAARSTALSNLESIFSISSTSTSPLSTTIGSDVNAFFNSLRSLEASPSDNSVRQGVMVAASTLALDFNTASGQIAQQTSSLNQQVTSTVSNVNSLLTSIASLNLQIETNSPNSDAGTLEDQRQQDLTQLSQYIGFDQIKTENNGLTLTTANGAMLVSEGQAAALSTSISIVTGNLDVMAASGTDITGTVTGGVLGGVIQARDADLPAVSTALDSLAYAIGSAVNTQNEAGYDGTGTPAIPGPPAIPGFKGNSGAAIFILPATSAGAASSIALATPNGSALATAGAYEGSSGNTNATALNALGSANMVSGETAAQFYSTFLTQLGSTVAQVSDENSTQQASLTQLTTQQSAESGVSLDQEAANLTLYERSYDAAAKIFSIVDQLMASALNLGEETTVT